MGGVATYSEGLLACLRELDGLHITVAAQKHPQPRGVALPVWSSGTTLIKDVFGHPVLDDADVVHMQHEPFLFGKGRAAFGPLNLPRKLSRAGIPCVITLHAVPFPSFFDGSTRTPQRLRALGKLYLKFLSRIQSHVDVFVVHEHPQVESLSDIAGIGTERIMVIPHGVGDIDEDAGLPADAPPTIGVYGFLTPYKDLHYLLDEFEKFRAMHEDARLLFSVAPHPQRKDRSSEALYTELMERAKNMPSVERMGYIADADLPAFLKGCHVIVTPYRYFVSSSGVMAHTLSAGTPTLVPDFIAHPHSQEWTFKYEPGGLARALTRLVPEFGRQADALETIATDRSWRNVALQHREMYERLL